MMQCAPVLIVTLNRYEHLKRCIDSLRKNKLACYTDLYIGFDYPPDQKYEKGYHQVKKYLGGGIDGFHDVIIMEHSSNRGVYRNVLDLRAAVYKKYDRYIITEDDNEFSPNYLEYMNKGLEKYEKDDDVLAISGYCYPIESSSFKGNVFKCGTYFAAYGYGIWKQKEEEMRKCLNMSFFCGLYRNSAYMKDLACQSRNQYANMVKGMLKYTSELISGNELREDDLAYGLYMVASGKKMVYPVISKARNWGYDGTGVNCGEINFKQQKTVNHRNFLFEKQSIDQDKDFSEIVEDLMVTQDQVNELMDVYFSIPKKEYIKVKIAYFFSRIIGLNNTQKLMVGIKNFV